jgi:hypothetical protein
VSWHSGVIKTLVIEDTGHQKRWCGGVTRAGIRRAGVAAARRDAAAAGNGASARADSLTRTIVLTVAAPIRGRRQSRYRKEGYSYGKLQGGGQGAGDVVMSTKTTTRIRRK